MDFSIPYGRQHITDDDINEVVKTLRSDYLTQGPRVREFEEAFASYIGAKYAIAVANGTAALHLSVLALQLADNKKVITSPITFSASANCIQYVCGRASFADIDRSTYLLSLEACEEQLRKNPNDFAGIIPVDFAGLPVDMAAFRNLADQYGLWIVEDACHAPGGAFTTSSGIYKCGNGEFADLGIFSFHPVKHIATGEGGMITTNNESLYRKLLKLRTHGITKNSFELTENHGGWYYEMQELGYNYRLTDIQAALGISQLKAAEQRFSRRQEIADTYYKAFQDLQIVMQKVPEGCSHAYHLFTIEVDNRKALYDYLHQHNIYAQVHYVPVHMMPYYQQLGFKKGDYPQAEAYYDRCLSLPMFPTLTMDEQAYVISKVKEFVS